MGIRSVFAAHFAELGGSWKAVALYLGSALPAYLAWRLFGESLSTPSLSIIATVEAVIATVLLTVIGSIYSGLPSAARRAKRARHRFDSVDQGDLVDPPDTEAYLAIKGRRDFESARVDALRGLFAHASAAVAYALTSLPLIVVCAQVAHSCPSRWGGYLVLGVLIASSWTLALVWLVLVQLHHLVRIDAEDLEPEDDGS